MKVIINRGFTGQSAFLVVRKDDETTAVCREGSDHCTFAAQQGDRISLELRYIGYLRLPLGTFTCHDANEVLYVSPTSFLKKCEQVGFRHTPLLCFILLLSKDNALFRPYEWFASAIVVFLLLVFLFLISLPIFPFTKNKLFQVTAV